MLKQIEELAKKEPKTLEQMVLKLAEETGEVAQAVLSHEQVSGNRYKELNSDHIKEECIDTILVATALYFKLENSNQEEFQTLIKAKQKKWAAHMNG
ncbi:MAG: MazG-like family protein [Vagococcus sp.]